MVMVHHAVHRPRSLSRRPSWVVAGSGASAGVDRLMAHPRPLAGIAACPAGDDGGRCVCDARFTAVAGRWMGSAAARTPGSEKKGPVNTYTRVIGRMVKGARVRRKENVQWFLCCVVKAQ